MKCYFYFIVAGLLSSAPNLTFAQGTVVFQNTTTSKIIDADTGQGVAPGIVRMGLYYTYPGGSYRDMELAVVTDNFAVIEGLYGLFSGGTVTIPGWTVGQQILVEVRAWSVGYDSYEELLASSSPGRTAASSDPFLVTLGGGIVPPTTIAEAGFRGLWINVHIPEGSTLSFLMIGLAVGGIFLWRRKPRSNRHWAPR